jgi:PAS domain S-box-containing protein
MADAKALPNLQAPSGSPSPAPTLPSEALLDALKMILLDAPLNEVLTSVTRLIEAHSAGMLCSIFLLDEDGLHLRYGVAADLPEAYRAATDGVCIGPNVGSCGAAAYLRQPVFVSDILSHPNWANFRSVVLQSGLRAAWSTPIMSHDGKVLGTFCMYYREVRHPGTDDIQLIDYASRIAGIAIERERSHLALKNALVEIKNYETRLRTIIDTIPALAWSARPDGSAEFFNRRWLDYAGLSRDEASDWGWTVALHPEDRGRLMDYWRHLLASGEAGEIEGRLRRFDGEFRWFLFRASPLRDGSGQVVKWFGTNTDLEERKRAEEALRSNEQSLRLIVDTIPGFVVTLSAAGEVELLNRQVLEYFGETTEELKNWATSDAVHPDDRARAMTLWSRSVETGHPYDDEHRLRRADGVRALPLRETEGRIIRWYVLCTDIDDRKKAEEAAVNTQALRPSFLSNRFRGRTD